MARRIIVGGAIALVVLVVGAQLLLPGYAEHRIESRLTEGGGTASASVSSFPAERLLFSDGDSLAVTGEGLNLPLGTNQDVLGHLDGFGKVDVSLSDSQAGPFAISSFELSRDGSGPYHLSSDSTTTPADLLGFSADQLGIAGGPILGFLAGRAPEGDREHPDPPRHGARVGRRAGPGHRGRRHGGRLSHGTARRADHLGDRGQAVGDASSAAAPRASPISAIAASSGGLTASPPSL